MELFTNLSLSALILILVSLYLIDKWLAMLLKSGLGIKAGMVEIGLKEQSKGDELYNIITKNEQAIYQEIKNKMSLDVGKIQMRLVRQLCNDTSLGAVLSALLAYIYADVFKAAILYNHYFEAWNQGKGNYLTEKKELITTAFFNSLGTSLATDIGEKWPHIKPIVHQYSCIILNRFSTHLMLGANKLINYYEQELLFGAGNLDGYLHKKIAKRKSEKKAYEYIYA